MMSYNRKRLVLFSWNKNNLYFITYLYILLQRVSTYVCHHQIILHFQNEGWLCIPSGSLSSALSPEQHRLFSVADCKQEGTDHPDGPSWWLRCLCSGWMAKVLCRMYWQCEMLGLHAVNMNAIGVSQDYAFGEHIKFRTKENTKLCNAFKSKSSL